MNKLYERKVINKFLEELQKVLAKYGYEIKDLKLTKEKVIITAKKLINSNYEL